MRLRAEIAWLGRFSLVSDPCNNALHGREFQLIQEMTPLTQSLDKDPMPRIVLPISWEESLDQDGALARAV